MEYVAWHLASDFYALQERNGGVQLLQTHHCVKSSFITYYIPSVLAYLLTKPVE